MLDWKRQNGASALLVKGARRIGKTTIVKEFAKKEYKSFVLIDFSKEDKNIKELFEDMSDLNYFFLRLSVLFGVSLHERDSVIIFDEVQLFPKARQAIKHLVADGRFDYIETGSLLSISRNVKDILIPSEEFAIEMQPMSFDEFRLATSGENSNSLEMAYQSEKPLGDAINRKLMKELRLYMLVGGMPQAVKSYIETNDLRIVDNVKRQILELYFNDLNKIDKRIPPLLKSIPAQLSLGSSRFRTRFVYKKSSNVKMDEALSDMEASMIVNLCYHVNDPNIGMALTIDPDKFRMYLLDTGLFVTLAFWDHDFTGNIIYEKLLFDKLPVNLGYIYENLVAQMLRSSGKKLYYYIFKEKPDSSNFSEIDFIIPRKNKICPIEVKSSGYARHASLDAFKRKYSSRIAESYLIYTKDFKKDDGVVYLPVYFTEYI